MVVKLFLKQLNSKPVHKFAHSLSFRTFEMALMVEGVVRQHPPIRLAPNSCHLIADNSNLSSSKQVDGCQFTSQSKKSIHKISSQSVHKIKYIAKTHQPSFSSAIPNLAAVGINNYQLLSQLEAQKFCRPSYSISIMSNQNKLASIYLSVNTWCIIWSLPIYLLKFADETFNKMGRCTVNSNCIYFVALIYYFKALLKTFPRWCILTIHRAEANPGWNFYVFFFKQLNTGL